IDFCMFCIDTSVSRDARTSISLAASISLIPVTILAIAACVSFAKSPTCCALCVTSSMLAVSCNAALEAVMPSSFKLSAASAILLIAELISPIDSAVCSADSDCWRMLLKKQRDHRNEEKNGAPQQRRHVPRNRKENGRDKNCA